MEKDNVQFKTDPLLIYLTQTKNAVTNETNKICMHLILGNESCDLDSMVSAIALAYLYSLTKYENTPMLVAPVLNMNSKDFPIRTENVHVLAKIGIKPEHLIFKDNINLTEKTKDMCIITLVDHHILSKKMQCLEKLVVEIFDHRPIDPDFKWGKEIITNIKQVGSCSTLIADEIFGVKNFSFIPSLANLLYEAIIVDTIGLKEETGRVSELDLQTCVKLEHLLNLSINYREVLFKELWRAHNSIEDLTTKQILLKDLKVLEDISIPGVPMLVSAFLKRVDSQEAVKEFYLENKISVLVLMGVETEGSFQRDLALYSNNLDDPLFNLIEKSLVSSENNLQLEKMDVGFQNLIYLKQNNVKPSRKQVIPILKECISSLKTSRRKSTTI